MKTTDENDIQGFANVEMQNDMTDFEKPTGNERSVYGTFAVLPLSKTAFTVANEPNKCQKSVSLPFTGGAYKWRVANKCVMAHFELTQLATNKLECQNVQGLSKLLL